LQGLGDIGREDEQVDQVRDALVTVIERGLPRP
jgi:hypothetical protein